VGRRLPSLEAGWGPSAPIRGPLEVLTAEAVTGCDLARGRDARHGVDQRCIAALQPEKSG